MKRKPLTSDAWEEALEAVWSDLTENAETRAAHEALKADHSARIDREASLVKALREAGEITDRYRRVLIGKPPGDALGHDEDRCVALLSIIRAELGASYE